MVDYWLNKLIYDLQSPATRTAYLADRDSVLARYPLAPEARAALLAADLATMVKRGVNPYLIRMYGYVVQMPEDAFVRQIEAAGVQGPA